MRKKIFKNNCRFMVGLVFGRLYIFNFHVYLFTSVMLTKVFIIFERSWPV